MKNFVKVCACMLAMIFSLTTYAVDIKDLYGKWIQTNTEDGVMMTSLYIFMPDGEMEQEINLVKNDSPKIKMECSGKAEYTLQNNTITFKVDPKNIEFKTFEIEGVDSSMMGMVIEQQKAQLSNQTQKLTDVNINGNVLTGMFMDSIEVTWIKVE